MALINTETDNSVASIAKVTMYGNTTKNMIQFYMKKFRLLVECVTLQWRNVTVADSDGFLGRNPFGILCTELSCQI